MTLIDADVVTGLAPAGLRFVEFDTADDRLPVAAVDAAQSCPGSEGRIDGEAVAITDPDRAARLNASWHRLAAEHGLFDAEGEFLLLLAGSWARVRLLPEWDLAGSQLPALGGYGVPEFTALSLDGRVLTRVTRWANGTVGVLVIRRPGTVPTIRRYVESMGRNRYLSADERAAARRWLAMW